ncbi:hypothetical protein [Amycolatopsis sp. NPDC051903]|uniref:hypothetical protein n=1 Tax=Amycolatopsis sp. NPDC051903 TaxID=3363936 RepID=UPI00378A6783
MSARRLRRRLAQLREDWAAAGEAADRWVEKTHSGSAGSTPEVEHDDVVIANDATIAGNVANHIVQS